MSKTPFKVGDRITLKKKHPCGGSDWEVYRIGADIGMKCLTCERRMMLTRRDAERRTITRVETNGVPGNAELDEPSETSG
jgi:hypothetical protein